MITIREERERRRRRRWLSFFLVIETEDVRRPSRWSRGHLHPHQWKSFRRTQQITPVKSLLPLSLATHLSSSHLHCYLTRKALPDSRSSTLITISSTSFHRFRVPLPWSCQSPVTRSSTLACTLTRKWIYSPTYFLIRDSTSVCSLNTQGSFPRP